MFFHQDNAAMYTANDFLRKMWWFVICSVTGYSTHISTQLLVVWQDYIRMQASCKPITCQLVSAQEQWINIACVPLYTYTQTEHTYMHTYIHMHTHTHTRAHTYIHTYIHACVHTYIHARTHTHTHTYVRTYMPWLPLIIFYYFLH
jgi:hypothetical protein